MTDRTHERAPAPDDPRKPDKLSDLPRRSWFAVLRRTIREFRDDECTDLAAALTYYSVLAIFPGLLALISTLGLFDLGGDSVRTILDILDPLVDKSTLDAVRDPLEELSRSQSAGVAFAVGLAGAL